MIKIFKILAIMALLASCSTIGDYTDSTPKKPKTRSEIILPEPEMDGNNVENWVMPNGSGPIFTQPFIDYSNPQSALAYPGYNRPAYTNPNDTALTVSNKERFIVVNIPSQTLRAFENGQEVIRSKLILGKPTNRTPTQRSRITSLKLNPDWHAPVGGGIERTYTRYLNEGRGDELRAIHIDWRRRSNGTYQFFQPSGPNNVLGRVKFEMYSPSNTYLHDTNRPDLFNMNERFFSFGCIRVQEWDDLAAWMLNMSTRDFVDYLLTNTHMHHKNIDPVDIHIVYWTNEIVDGQERSWPDIYNRN